MKKMRGKERADLMSEQTKAILDSLAKKLSKKADNYPDCRQYC